MKLILKQQNIFRIMFETVKKDGENMAALLSNMQSGLKTFEKVFESLESNYEPFLSAEFRNEFYKGVL